MNKGTEHRVVRDYESPYPEPIRFRKGGKVIVGELSTHDPNWENWLWCSGEQGNEAWVPDQYLRIKGNSGVLLRDYDARELSVTVGEKVLLDEVVNGFGMIQKMDKSRGWVPMKCLEKVEA